MAKGYIGVGPERGKYVESDDAYAYALRKCHVRQGGTVNKEFADMLVEWFFSGNWMEDDGDG